MIWFIFGMQIIDSSKFYWQMSWNHTFITHSFLLKGEDWPLCIPCQEPFSVKHFLLECTDFRIIRSRFFRVNGLKELFDTVEPV